MRIELDPALAMLVPPVAQPTLVVGEEYITRPLMLADAQRIEELDQHDDASNAEWLAGVFVHGRAPSCVDELRRRATTTEIVGREQRHATNQQVLLIVEVLAECVRVASGNALAAAGTAARAATRRATGGTRPSASPTRDG